MSQAGETTERTSAAAGSATNGSATNGSATNGSATNGSATNGSGLKARLNWLRAGVLGANDGIISTAGLVVGVAAATTDRSAILTAGVAGLVAGAVSMALGEYVSVSSQRDTELALIAAEQRELAEDPDGELQELADAYVAKGLSQETAMRVAAELTEHDAVRAHLDVQYGLDAEDLTNAWHAAVASAIAFTAGAIIPLLAVVLPPGAIRIPVTFAAVLVALVTTGTVSARIGGAKRMRAVIRLVVGGALAMAVTFGIGALLGQTITA